VELYTRYTKKYNNIREGEGLKSIKHDGAMKMKVLFVSGMLVSSLACLYVRQGEEVKLIN
jgi:hypothetical protein